jgi:hypothetical protein
MARLSLQVLDMLLESCCNDVLTKQLAVLSQPRAANIEDGESGQPPCRSPKQMQVAVVKAEFFY